MSEPQEQYDTNTDAQPTPGPWTNKYAGNPASDVQTMGVKTPGDRPSYVAQTNMARPEKENIANARLIAAAGTGAQEAKEMGYDPVAAVEALPHLLSALHRLNETMEADEMEPGTLTPTGMREVVKDALAAARG